jgi:hypothetical protein
MWGYDGKIKELIISPLSFFRGQMGHFRKWGISCPPVWNGIFALKVTYL